VFEAGGQKQYAANLKDYPDSVNQSLGIVLTYLADLVRFIKADSVTRHYVLVSVNLLQNVKPH